MSKRIGLPADKRAQSSASVNPEVDTPRARERKRLLDAVAGLARDRGYQSVKIGDIVTRAEVSRKTFYDNFESKEMAFISVMDVTTAEALDRIDRAFAEADSWPNGVSASIAALLEVLAENRAYAYCSLIESLSATPSTTRHYEDFLGRVCELFEPGDKDVPPGIVEQLPRTTTETIVGGIFWLIFQAIRRGERDLSSLCPELVDFALAPYHGAEEATELATHAPHGTPSISMEQLLQNAARIRASRPRAATDPDADAATLIREDRER